MKRIKPASRRLLQLEVVATKRLSESLQLVTVGGEHLADFCPLGGDQAFRLLFRHPANDTVEMPTASGAAWMIQYLRSNKAVRPVARLYTVRAYRPAERELDIMFALHEGDAPAATWARGVEPGEPVAIFDEGGVYSPEPGVAWQLLVGDESALPAILAILETDRTGLPTEVYCEVPTPDDIPAVEVGPRVNVHWVTRQHAHDVPGQAALRAVTGATLPEGRFAAFVAGESKLSTGLRRHLVNQCGVAKSDIAFVGYWRHGQASVG